ncbi:MAG TPA: NusA N-terminal domain-containing protein, partial [Bacteroidia bacterium]|nr:NusA N-terminal domain-containing protein [Bacteroidia bacterium]
MDHAVLIESFSEFKDSKNIDRATLMSIMEDVFRAMVRKKYGEDNNVDVVINTDKGDVEMYRNRTIVEDGMVEDDNTQIALSDALKIESDFEVGEDVTEQILLDDFGRRAVLAARQNLVARIMELEKESIYQKYKDRVGEIVTGEVYQVWKKEIMVMDD